MPDWLSAPPAAGTSVRTRGITERAGKNNAKEYFYENEENGSGLLICSCMHTTHTTHNNNDFGYATINNCCAY